MYIKLQLVILEVTDHFNVNNSRSEIIKINLTEIGSEAGSSGSGLGLVTHACEHCNKFRVPGKAIFLKIFATRGQIRSKELLFRYGNQRLAWYLRNAGRMGGYSPDEGVRSSDY
jgi:hypothetical protein